MPVPPSPYFRSFLVAAWSAMVPGFASVALAAPELPALAADEQAVTVSGISSGAYMAVQFQVAHSRIVRGAGIVAGGPYYCAKSSSWRATTNCMAPSKWSPVPSLALNNETVDTIARAGRIDPPEFLRDDRVWLLSGGADQTVARPVVDALAEFYGSRLPSAALRYLKPPSAGHALPSAVDPAANACPTSEPPFINRCPDPERPGTLDAPGSLLQHLSLTPLAAAAPGTPLAALFDQRPFIVGKAIDASLADAGYVFIPSTCRSGGCQVHVAFHGCRQNAQQVGTRFVDAAGYNRWAETNRLIVLYPQTVARSGFTAGSWTWLYNPKACWDWWGYTGGDYHTQSGKQIAAVRKMIRQLASPLAPRATSRAQAILAATNQSTQR